MDNTKNLQVVFTGDSASLSKTFAEVQAQAATTNGAIEGLTKNLGSFGSNAKALGSTMTAGLTLPLVGIGVAAVKLATNFQASMELIHTQAGASQQEVDKLSGAVLNLAKTDSYFSAQQLSGGLYHLESLGLRGAAAMSALKTASDMAATGIAPLEDTTSALGAALVTGIKGTEDLNKAAGMLDATIGQGNMRMSDLVAALGSGILPVAKNAGLGLIDVGAALATLTDNGMRADEAATRLRMTFALMEAPSKKAQGVLKELGMSSTDMAMEMRTKGLIPALTDLRDHLIKTYGTTDEGKTKMAQALTEIFGGGRSSAAAQTLINELDRMQTKFDQIGTQSSGFAERVGASQQTMSFQFHAAWNKITADLTSLGNNYAPQAEQAFKHIANAVSDVTNWLDHLSKGQKQTVIDIALVLAAVGPVLIIFGTLAKSIIAITTLLEIFGGAAAALPAIFSGAFGAIGAIVASPLLMPAIAIGAAIASLMAVYEAAIKVIDTINVVKNMNAGIEADRLSTNHAISQMEGLTLSSDPAQRDRAYKALHNLHVQGYATGTDFAQGGLSLVGEQGPELVNLARGSQVINNSQTTQMMGGGGGQTFNITVQAGTVVGMNGMQDLANTIYQTLQRNARAQGMSLPNIGSAVPTG